MPGASGGRDDCFGPRGRLTFVGADADELAVLHMLLVNSDASDAIPRLVGEPKPAPRSEGRARVLLERRGEPGEDKVGDKG